jgi:simple sugar transport system substrate-binding protein
MSRLVLIRVFAPFLAALFALAAIPTAGVGAQPAPYRFVVVTHGQASDPFWSVAKAGVDQAAKDLGVSV